MPELPEVETVVRDLCESLLGRVLCDLKIGRKTLRRSASPPHRAHVAGRTVRTITRRGKWIVIDLDGPLLLVHLGMTGQLTVTPADVPRRNHTHFVFTLDDGRELRFRDVRRFGSVSIFPDRGVLDAFFVASKLGPEPFDLEPRAWHAGLSKTRRNLKACLLDQRLVAGVGNIYADESLFEARLHPMRLGHELRRAEAERLRRAIVAVLTHAISLRGSTIRDYIGGSGLQGGFQDEFRVYGRTGEPCVRCKTPIARIVLAGRSTHFCPRCQR